MEHPPRETSNPLQPSLQNANRQRIPQETAAYPNPLLQKVQLNLRHNIASPTDSLMSPCTAKLQAHKNKHYIKSRPQALLSRMQNATNAHGNQAPSS